jgi:hypothetical protein
MQKNAKMQNVPKTPEILGVFIENRAVAICRSIEKVSKMTPKIPVHTQHFFFSAREAFSGFFRLST